MFANQTLGEPSEGARRYDEGPYLFMRGIIVEDDMLPYTSSPRARGFEGRMKS